MLDEPALRGRVLDIGCGGDIHACLRDVPAACTQLDGVDPDAKVLHHPKLTRRWHGTFESSDIPRSAYDAAYAFSVVEHIEAARPFFEKLAAVLKPGGVFWALTPHWHHPFAVLARTVEVLGGKRFMSRHTSGVNDYPAYYRLNARRAVLRNIEGLGFVSADFQYFTAPGWEQGYFPRGTKWIGRAYDLLLGNRFAACKLLIAYRLQNTGGKPVQ